MAHMREVSEDEVAGHNTKNDLWLVIHGKGTCLNLVNVQFVISLV
jgi:hypothetical protein